MRIIDRVRIWLRRILAHEPVLFAVCRCSERCVYAGGLKGRPVSLVFGAMGCWKCDKFGVDCYGPKLVER